MIGLSQNDILRERQRIRERRNRALSEYYAAVAEDERLVRMDGPSSDKQTAVEVASEVCAALHIDIWDLFSRNREQHVTYARGVCQYIIRKKCEWSFPRIGRSFERDHTSVINQCKAIERRMGQSPAFAAMVNKIRARVDARLTILLEDTDAEPNHDSQGTGRISAGGPVNHLSATQEKEIAGVQDRVRLAVQPGPDQPMVAPQ